MRTTVTIDPDVEQTLRLAMQQSGKSFKATLNEALRKGLADSVPDTPEEPFTVKPKDMGLRPGIDETKLNQLVDDLEVEAYLDKTQRLEGQHPNSDLTTSEEDS